jgi:hypothetical protein
VSTFDITYNADGNDMRRDDGQRGKRTELLEKLEALMANEVDVKAAREAERVAWEATQTSPKMRTRARAKAAMEVEEAYADAAAAVWVRMKARAESWAEADTDAEAEAKEAKARAKRGAELAAAADTRGKP